MALHYSPFYDTGIIVPGAERQEKEKEKCKDSKEKCTKRNDKSAEQRQ